MDTVTRDEFFTKPEVAEAVAELRRVIRGVLPSGTFAEREEAVLAITNEAMRTLLEEELQALANGFGDRLLINGKEFKQHQPGGAKYHCLGGPIEVVRYTYRPVDERNGPTVVPLELVAGLAEGATPALAYNVAYGYGQHDMRQHGESLAATWRTPPPRATLERMAKRLAKKAQSQAPKIEKILRQMEEVPEGACGISTGLDRTAVPMAEERPADAPPKRGKKRRKPRERRAPKPIDVAWRMAYVGTVAFVDEYGETLATRRYAIPACDDPSTVVTKMMADVREAMRRKPSLTVGIVQDGAPEMWNVLRSGLSELQRAGVIPDWKEGIDRYHLLERLAKALAIVEPDAEKRKSTLSTWNERLDRDDSAIDRIETDLTQRCIDLEPIDQDALMEHLGYIENNKDRMRYPTLSKAGLPIGSGVTESAAKTVIGRRAKNSGQRWSEPGLRGVLTLRAIHQSARLPRFWTYLSRRYTAVVNEAA
ncbi:MAG: hypothetical protein HYZ29_01015 [Myxococcales bacterium]|nr:hypothetical protein [Myxococcales bacterium]